MNALIQSFIRRAAALLAGSVMCVSATANVIENDAAIRVSPAGGGQFLTLTKSFTQSGQGLFGFNIDPVGTKAYAFSAIGIAEPYGLYQAAVGQVFDEAFLQGHAPIASNFGTATSTTQTFALNETKIFAYWDAGWTNRPETFGWFGITRTSAGLAVTSGASALGSGIIVGTINAVPEPGTFGLGLVGLAMLALAVRRGTRQQRLQAPSTSCPA